MADFTFENQGTKTYLVYQIQNDADLDSMSLGMLTNNNISGLAPALFTQMDLQKFIKYDISAKISVKQFFSGPVNKKRLLGVFTGVIDAMLNAEDYMIDPRTIMLDLDYIFADVSTCETTLICLPVVSEAKDVSLGVFFKNIMFSTQFDQTENCDHVAKIINYLNSAPVFSATDFKALLNQIQRETKQTAAPQQSAAKVVTRPVSTAAAKPVETFGPPVTATVKKTPVQQVQQPVETPQPVAPITPPPAGSTVPEQPKGKKSKEKNKEKDDNKMSFMYLMMHYSKENKEEYNRQRSGEAAAPAASAPVEEPKKKKGKEKKSKEKAPKTNTAAQSVGFKVPGAPDNFVIPGQSTPVGTPAQQTVSAQPQIQQTVKQAAQQQVQQAVQQQVIQQQAQQASVPHSAPGNFGETVVLGGGGIGETTVLVANPPTETRAATPYLIRMSNNERIPVNKPVFRIGKERSYVDYFIGDNSAISRSHANIIQRGEQYFILDTNSKNHTYVDGRMIPSNAEFELVNGTKLRLANEDFEFQLL